MPQATIPDASFDPRRHTELPIEFQRGAVIRYRAQGALRDVGKALGLTEDLIKLLSSQVWGWSEKGVEPKHAEELNLNLQAGASSLRSCSLAN